MATEAGEEPFKVTSAELIRSYRGVPCQLNSRLRHRKIGYTLHRRPIVNAVLQKPAADQARYLKVMTHFF
jgi:hypothetical protein